MGLRARGYVFRVWALGPRVLVVSYWVARGSRGMTTSIYSLQI